MKRFAKMVGCLLAIVCLMACLMPLSALAAGHTIYGNGNFGIYIDIDSGYYSSYAGIATWGKYAYTTSGCAWFASARVRELTGKGTTIWSGQAWWNNYASCGFSRSTVLTLGQRAIACWTGHVAVIEGKTSSGAIIVSEGGVSHLNYVGSGNGYCHITTFSSEAALKRESSSSFLGYVYIGGGVAPSVTLTYNDFAETSVSMFVGEHDARIGHTISISGAPISAVTSVGINLYDADDMSLVGSKTEKPISKNGVINVWYTIKEELTNGVDLKSGHNYIGIFQATLSATYGGKTYTYSHPFKTAGVNVSSITLDLTSLNCTVGGIGYLNASVGPSSASNRAVKWSSSNLNVAAVDNYGTVTGMGLGTATITCSATDGSGVYATCQVTVLSVAMRDSDFVLTMQEPGNRAWLFTTVTPSSATGARWTSSDNNVVWCNGNLIQAEGEGTATITVSYFNGPSASCTVTVVNALPTLTLPAGLAAVEESAFSGTSAERVILPDGCASIGESAFSDCPGLRFVYIPESVSSIAASAFSGDGKVCILCKSDSYAQTFARNNGLRYYCTDASIF